MGHESSSIFCNGWFNEGLKVPLPLRITSKDVLNDIEDHNSSFLSSENGSLKFLLFNVLP